MIDRKSVYKSLRSAGVKSVKISWIANPWVFPHTTNFVLSPTTYGFLSEPGRIPNDVPLFLYPPSTLEEELGCLTFETMGYATTLTVEELRSYQNEHAIWHKIADTSTNWLKRVALKFHYEILLKRAPITKKLIQRAILSAYNARVSSSKKTKFDPEAPLSNVSRSLDEPVPKTETKWTSSWRWLLLRLPSLADFARGSGYGDGIFPRASRGGGYLDLDLPVIVEHRGYGIVHVRTDVTASSLSESDLQISIPFGAYVGPVGMIPLINHKEFFIRDANGKYPDPSEAIKIIEAANQIANASGNPGFIFGLFPHVSAASKIAVGAAI